MVAFAMTEEASAEVLKDAMQRWPGKEGYFPYLFSVFCDLHGFKHPREIRKFADKCGMEITLVAMSEANAK